MKKEIQDHVILKNKDYSFVKENGETIEGLVTDIKFINGVSEADFEVLIELDSQTTEAFHSNEVIDVIERDLDPSV